ncbi:MAG TPA: hypothetical protein VG733_15655 [Chthoniobacteraceae bacterium]|nr:hypothetical protein [Chthoniobacteraceae bacterium]
MSTVLLNKREVALLKSAARKGDDNANFQELLLKLDKLVNDRTGQIQIPPDLMLLIHKYGADVGKLSWRGTLFSIFGRTMGDSFGQHPDTCTELIDIDKKPTKTSGEEDRNWRSV